MATNTADTPFRKFARLTQPSFVEPIVKILKTPVGAISAGVVLLLVLTAIFGQFIAPYSFRSPSADTYMGPSAAHWLGTDNLGRDTLSRDIQGAKISIYAGFLNVTFGTITGCIIGITSGFIGGKTDLIAQRFVDSIQAVPALLLTMAILSVLTPSTTNALSLIHI